MWHCTGAVTWCVNTVLGLIYLLPLEQIRIVALGVLSSSEYPGIWLQVIPLGGPFWWFLRSYQQVAAEMSLMQQDCHYRRDSLCCWQPDFLLNRCLTAAWVGEPSISSFWKTGNSRAWGTLSWAVAYWRDTWCRVLLSRSGYCPFLQVVINPSSCQALPQSNKLRPCLSLDWAGVAEQVALS